MRLLTICPTRGRPALFNRMCDSFMGTRSPGTHMVAYLDETDTTLPKYRTSSECIERRSGAFLWMAEVVNRAVLEWHPKAEYYQIINDDHVYRTPHWDSLLIEAIHLAGGWGYAYGRTENLPTAAVISANITRALGFYFPSGFRHQFVDNYERDLFTESGMAIHVPEVWVEHMHPGFGKGNDDDTYRLGGSDFNQGKQRYERWRRDEMASHVASLVVARLIGKA